jgi:anion-transporting  ArsA/GET3 family ATPase
MPAPLTWISSVRTILRRSRRSPMSHDDNNQTVKVNDKHEQKETALDNHELLLHAVSMLLSDICRTRFQLLMVTEEDPSEAAKEVIDGLDRYDFLGDVAVSNTSYLELKKQIESDISNEAERVIREQNPR